MTFHPIAYRWVLVLHHWYNIGMLPPYSLLGKHWVGTVDHGRLCYLTTCYTLMTVRDHFA